MVEHVSSSLPFITTACRRDDCSHMPGGGGGGAGAGEFMIFGFICIACTASIPSLLSYNAI